MTYKAMPMDRIKDSFDRLAASGTMGVIPYLTVGFPTVKDTISLVQALSEGGADVIELGVPFSDPIADGPTIQESSFHALQQGVNLEICLEVCEGLRKRGMETPLVLMGYYNPILNCGIDEFTEAASTAGVDGIIVPDLPYEESGPLHDSCKQRGISFIPLLAPTSTDIRIAQSCQRASGFVYCVSITGVTGARDELPDGVDAFIDRVRVHTELPLAVGFGISKRYQVESLSRGAQAAVVGSALIDLIRRSQDDIRGMAVKNFVMDLKGTLTT